MTPQQQKQLSDAPDDTALNSFRQEIDAIDDKLIALLLERTKIIEKVAVHKARNCPRPCHIRSGREAQMVRRIYQTFKNSSSKFPPAAAASIWRHIIAASTAIESNMAVSAYTPEGNEEYYWLAREYFGGFTPITKHASFGRVITDVMEDKAAIGILPYPINDAPDAWWRHTHHAGKTWPKVFAIVPFMLESRTVRTTKLALAIAKVEPEDTGDDRSLLSITVDENTSASRLNSALKKAGLEATWMIGDENKRDRYHLVEVRGFANEQSPKVQTLLKEMGDSVVQFVALGSYARPLILSAKNKA